MARAPGRGGASMTGFAPRRIRSLKIGFAKRRILCFTYHMEQKQNSESAPGPLSPSEGNRLRYRDGREIPPTHPDHGPMHLLPRQEDGSFAAYYYCSKAELYDAEIPGPPPRRYRRDGFTPERQEEFLEAIRGGASGREAARRIGISPTTAYNLYNSPDAPAFRAAWDEAARVTDIVLEDTAFDRAVNGQEEIVYHQGQRVGVRWRYDNKLLMQLLRARNPLKYAPLSELEGWHRHRGVAPPPDVDGALERLRAAEAEWGRRLPGEEKLQIAAPAENTPETPVIASEARQSSAVSVTAPEAGLPRRCAPRNDGAKEADAPSESTSTAVNAADASTSSTSPGNEPAGESNVESTSSTSSANEQVEDRDAPSTSSTSSGSGPEPPAPAASP